MSSSSAVLSIDLEAVAANYRALCARVAPASCAAVVKADAYGLGVAEIATRLWQEGCTRFFVAHLEEALGLRGLLPQAEIMFFHGVQDAEEADMAAEKALLPVLNSLHQIAVWRDHAKQRERALPCLLHVDTGMHRLGLPMEEALALVENGLPPELDVRVVMSHLACIATPEHPLNACQLARAAQIQQAFAPLPFSLANSGGCAAGSDYHYDLVRPGCALYGIHSVPSQGPLWQQVVELRAPILQIRTLQQEGSVGYGATITLPKGSQVATLPVGYADGYLRSLSSSGACVEIAGTRCPVIGRVSMDLITVDVTHLPDAVLRAEDRLDAVLLGGKATSVDQVASWAGTIGYEVLTRLGARFTRRYLSR